MMSPGSATPPRLAGSVRRTSHVDMSFEGELLRLAGAARDMVTTSATEITAGYGEVDALLDGERRLRELRTVPEHDGASRLLGAPIGSGFRAAVARAVPDEVAGGTPLALLLDDLPVASLISGYAQLYGGLAAPVIADLSPRADICSGWRRDGTMMDAARTGSGLLTIGPIAPSLADEHAADPLGWHDIGPLSPGAMRRRRLIDVHPDGGRWRITAMFRDSHLDDERVETILHEYSLTAEVDASTGTIVGCAAVPRVLPWVECPVAAASADRLAGTAIDEVRDRVRAEFRGTSTCTHLNDLLRSLGDVPTLVTLLDS
jgi:Protein of unknown function (DUF2889)